MGSRYPGPIQGNLLDVATAVNPSLRQGLITTCCCRAAMALVASGSASPICQALVAMGDQHILNGLQDRRYRGLAAPR